GTFTASVATDILTLSISNANFATGVPVTVTNPVPANLPAPLTIDTTYYVIRIGASGTSPGTIKLATTYANAIANIPIDITSAGTAPHTITVSGQLQLGSVTSHPGTIVACKT